MKLSRRKMALAVTISDRCGRALSFAADATGLMQTRPSAKHRGNPCKAGPACIHLSLQLLWLTQHCWPGTYCMNICCWYNIPWVLCTYYICTHRDHFPTLKPGVWIQGVAWLLVHAGLAINIVGNWDKKLLASNFSFLVANKLGME